MELLKTILLGVCAFGCIWLSLQNNRLYNIEAKHEMCKSVRNTCDGNCDTCAWK